MADDRIFTFDVCLLLPGLGGLGGLGGSRPRDMTRRGVPVEFRGNFRVRSARFGERGLASPISRCGDVLVRSPWVETQRSIPGRRATTCPNRYWHSAITEN